MDAQAYLAPALRDGRAWGFGINLYAVRSQRNWGVGDFTDLRDLVRFAASIGADTVGINPLHALHYVDPEAASPYAPTSRYFRNPIYIDIEAIPEYTVDAPKAAALRERVASEPFTRALQGLRDAPEVAYARVARAKWSALDELYAVMRDVRGTRLAAFRTFADDGGERLERFAIYEAMTEAFASDGGRIRGWLTWDETYRDADADAVRAWAAKHRRRVDYFKYLQFVADEQLARAAHAARDLAIGLYLDVAVGVDINSADVWSDRGAYVLDETVGAPPDPLGPQGQNWGFPPLDPERMLAANGAAFANLLAANMQHAGALRLDHVMALMRLFRIPRGRIAADGAYVAYPFDALLAIATAQSAHARCTIVGEDLGTVPDGFRERMERAAVLSYRVLLFERDEDGAFRAPGRYPRLALATATTHDVPTIPGWFAGRDITARESIGHMSPADGAHARRVRRVEASQLLAAMETHGVLSPPDVAAAHRMLDMDAGDRRAYEPLVRGAYRYLAASPANLVLVQLDDAALEPDQVNLPGTFNEYPNWRRKNGLQLGAIASDACIAGLASDVADRVKKGIAR